MKDVSRNRFLLCFRPVVDMDQLVVDSKAEVKCSDEQPLACLGVYKKKNVKAHFKSNMFILDYRFSKISGNSLIIHSSRKASFYRSFKSIFSNSSMTKRVNDGKCLAKDSDGSKLDCSSSNSTKSLETSDGDSIIINNVEDVKEIKKNLVSSTSSSSTSSLCYCSAISTSASETNNNLSTCLSKTINNSKLNQERESQTKNMGNFLIYLLLFSLSMTVFWGKVCAILFTSIWLYFLRFRDNVNPSKYATSIPKRKECKVYRRRIIMEELLERNHRLAPESHRRRYKFLT